MTAPALYAALPESVPVIQCSPPSWAAQIALLEVGVEHEVQWLRFDRGEHRSERMLAMSAAGTVPILVDGAAVLTDTVEILDHIAGLGRGLPLGDAPRRDRARAVKEAGMAGFRAMMTGAEAAGAWPATREALDDWCAAGDPATAGLDVPGLLVFVYVVTAQHLGMSVAVWPELGAFLRWVRRRDSVQRAWPATFGAIH